MHQKNKIEFPIITDTEFLGGVLVSCIEEWRLVSKSSPKGFSFLLLEVLKTETVNEQIAHDAIQLAVNIANCSDAEKRELFSAFNEIKVYFNQKIG